MSEETVLQKVIKSLEDGMWAFTPPNQDAIRLVIKQIEEVIKERDSWKASSDSWESTAKLVSKLPCGHPNDCAYDKNADGRWANIGCVWCERDALRVDLETVKSDRNKAGLQERQKYLPKIEELAAELRAFATELGNLKGMAGLHIHFDQENQVPFCGCCNQELDEKGNGHRQECLAERVLDAKALYRPITQSVLKAAREDARPTGISEN